ncbi:rRNA maturation RNase YbeY [Chitinispirillales bacterium ANBcel5]|uniref:rRNA maturation RNase YbeY n=1 Tax=Cellulosispirillum alkaliphilum TaxID=3039283 RepID=UPI002A5827F7|nr:rRNA maturation RNase YbeY [Chitinispirillales bacterium ANBcel5]
MGDCPSLEIIHDYKQLPSQEMALQEMACLIYEGENVSPKQTVSLILCSDYIIKRLNRDYRKQDKATDVLSFRFNEPDFLGEIYISLQRTSLQARRYGLSYEQELLRLFVHGMFHLLGYDHQDSAQRQEMESKERKYFDV